MLPRVVFEHVEVTLVGLDLVVGDLVLPRKVEVRGGEATEVRKIPGEGQVRGDLLGRAEFGDGLEHACTLVGLAENQLGLHVLDVRVRVLLEAVLQDVDEALRGGDRACSW